MSDQSRELKPGMIVLIDPLEGNAPGNRGMLKEIVGVQKIDRPKTNSVDELTKWSIILTDAPDKGDPRVTAWHVQGWLVPLDVAEEEGS